MKAIFPTILLSCFSLVHGFAQFSEEPVKEPKTGFFIGGSVNFSQSENLRPSFFIDGIGIVGGSNENSKNSSYSLRPIAGYQLNNHWILGLEFLLSHFKTENDSPANGFFLQKNTRNSLGIFMRYLINPNSKFQVFVSPYFRKSFEKSTLSFNTIDPSEFNSELSSNDIGISLGAQYEISPWLRLNVNVGGLDFKFGKKTNDPFNFEPGESDFNSFAFNFNGGSIFFGAEFLF